MEVFADGVSKGTRQMTFCCSRYTFVDVRCKKEIDVVFTIDSNSPTAFAFYSFGFWRMPSDVHTVSLEGKRVAVLGDSWTQFPAVGNGLSDHSSFNEIVIRPDGTQGNGYGYFPKELARFTGAIVDNWGKSNMRADDWGLPMIDTVLDYADYDYLILEFFTNDANYGIPYSTWAKNLAKICRKCEARGVRPIIMGPCRNNGVSIYASYWKTMFMGVGAI
jgi:hypothetical protein